MRVSLQQAYVLHTRAFRDSSLLVELFTREHGRVSMVAKGVKGGTRRKSSGGSQAALLQPFVPLLCSWVGRSDLKTSTGCEARGTGPGLVGRRLYCGLYINELLSRLLHHYDAHEALYDVYEESLQRLARESELDLLLRQFEFRLLEELGYGFELSQEGLSGEPLSETGWYVFHQEHGLIAADAQPGADMPSFSGADLLAISRGEFNVELRRTAKRLMRQALAPHLGDKPLKSRELFRKQA
ncbi:MAG: DNA repair protein RecO [Gammaproteobacteria bacterium]|nr:DNA repair protein RecO [Gammaproteobacteria bacterium]